jgi:hypothetical protein
MTTVLRYTASRYIAITRAVSNRSWLETPLGELEPLKHAPLPAEGSELLCAGMELARRRATSGQDLLFLAQTWSCGDNDGIAVVWVQHSDDEIIRGSGGWRSSRSWHPVRPSQSSKRTAATHSWRPRPKPCFHNWQSGGWWSSEQRPGCARRCTVRSSAATAAPVSDTHTTGDKSGWGAPPQDRVIAHEFVLALPDRAPPDRGHDDDGQTSTSAARRQPANTRSRRRDLRVGADVCGS